jgi:hypothetical protein
MKIYQTHRHLMRATVWLALLSLVVLCAVFLVPYGGPRLTPSQQAAHDAVAGAEAGDPIWIHYQNMKTRPYKWEGTWRGTGRKVTAEDIAAAPCKVRSGKETSYIWPDDVIVLEPHSHINEFWHEQQHCYDFRAGIRDRAELERRAMIAEINGEFIK